MIEYYIYLRGTKLYHITNTELVVKTVSQLQKIGYKEEDITVVTVINGIVFNGKKEK